MSEGKLEALIDKCTSSETSVEDWGAIMDICDLINTSKPLVGHAINAIVTNIGIPARKRLSLVLLHAITQNCGVEPVSELAKNTQWAEAVSSDSESRETNQQIISDCESANPADIDSLKSLGPKRLNVMFKVCALYNFNASEPAELSFQKGDVIEVIEKVYSEWWKGRLNGSEGIFPSNYVESYESSNAATPVLAPAPVVPTNAAAPAPVIEQQTIPKMSQEDYILSQAPLVEKLLNILTTAAHSDEGCNVLDRDDVQQMYSEIVQLRPALVETIGIYNKETRNLLDQTQKLRKSRQQYEVLMRKSTSQP